LFIKYKKWINVFTIIILILSLFNNFQITYATSNETDEVDFIDIPTEYWAKEEIERMVRLGLMSGLTDGNFLPNKSVPKEEFIKILINATHKPLVFGKQTFKDVELGRWSNPYIEASVNESIILQDEYGKLLKPSQPVSREEMAVMVTRTLKLQEVDGTLPFKDNNLINSEYRGLIKSLYESGTINDIIESKFQPNKAVTRAQIAVIISRIIDYQEYLLPQRENLRDTTNSSQLLPHVKKLNDKTIESIIRISEDSSTITFSKKTGQVSSLTKGDIIALPPIKGYPFGLVKRIVKIQGIDSSLEVFTEDPDLTEVVKSIDIAQKIPIIDQYITPEEGITVELVTEATANKDNIMSIASIHTSDNIGIENYNIVFNIEKNFYEDISEENDKNTSNSVTLSGKLMLKQPTASVDVYYSNSIIKNARISLSAEQELDATLASSASVEMQKSIRIAKFILPISGAIGVTGEVNLVFKTNAKASLEMGITETFKMDSGVRVFPHQHENSTIVHYHNKKYEYNNFDASVIPIKGSGEISGAIGGQFNILATYSQLPFAGIENTAEIEAKIKATDDFCFERSLNLRADSKAKVYLIGITGEYLLYKYEQSLVDPQHTCPKIQSIEVIPSIITLEPGLQQQLTVNGIYKDDIKKDITLSKGTSYQSEDDTVVSVSDTGLVSVSEQAFVGDQVFIVVSHGNISEKVQVNIGNESSVPNEINPAIAWDKRFMGSVKTPKIANDGTIYLTEGGGNLVSLTPNGHERWRFKGSSYVTGTPSIGVDGTIYVGGLKKLYALTPNGEQKWEGPLLFERGDIGEPVITDDTIYVGGSHYTEGGTIYAVDPSGSLKWTQRLTVEGNGIVFTPVMSNDNVLYVTTGDTLFAVDSENGEILWSTEGLKISGSPAINSNGDIYVISSLYSNVYAFNSSGTMKWEYDLGYFEYLFPWGSSPIVGQNGIIFVNGSRKIFGFQDLGDKALLVNTKIVERGTSKPVLGDDGYLYTVSREYVNQEVGNSSTLNVWDSSHNLVWKNNLTTKENKYFGTMPTVSSDGTKVYIGGAEIYSITTTDLVNRAMFTEASYSLNENKMILTDFTGVESNSKFDLTRLSYYDGANTYTLTSSYTRTTSESELSPGSYFYDSSLNHLVIILTDTDAETLESLDLTSNENDSVQVSRGWNVDPKGNEADDFSDINVIVVD
jgi:hypothetical protein